MLRVSTRITTECILYRKGILKNFHGFSRLVNVDLERHCPFKLVVCNQWEFNVTLAKPHQSLAQRSCRLPLSRYFCIRTKRIRLAHWLICILWSHLFKCFLLLVSFLFLSVVFVYVFQFCEITL